MVMCAEDRQLIELFSTFITFVSETRTKWVKDLQLARKMETVLSANPRETSTAFWVEYWCVGRGSDNINRFPERHLQAYLQRACYRAAQSRFYRNRQNNPTITLRDYFQIAFLATDNIIQNYSYQRNPNLESHGLIVYIRKLQSYERTQNINPNATSWFLLLRTSETKIEEALNLSGLSPQVIEFILLALDCFQQYYVAGENLRNQTFQEPSPETWNLILAAYNHRASGLNYPVANLNQIQTWLNNCVQAIRRLNARTEISLDTPITAQEGSEFTLLDTIPSHEASSSEYQSIQRVRRILIGIINTFEEKSTSATNSQTQRDKYTEISRILCLYYGGDLDQKTIAQRVYGDAKFQPTVSRRLTTANTEAVKIFLNEINQDLHSQDNLNDINYITEMLKECLKKYYGEKFSQGGC